MIDWQFFLNKTRLLIHICCIVTFAANLGIVGRAIVQEERGRTPFGTPDYAGFYVAATILNQGSPERLYDRELQSTLLHTLLPGMRPDEEYPFAHAPFVAYFLRPLAWMPFHWSYPLWLAILGGVALAGFGVIHRSTTGIPPGNRTTAFLVSVSYLPLMLECWLAGQLSIVGMFWIAVALGSLRLGRLAGCGAALAMCLYKPTLMMWTLPVLIVAGQWRILGGFATGAAGLALLSLAAVGWSGCRSYFDMLIGYAHHASAGSAGFKVFKHVDLNTFFTLLLGGPHGTGRGVLLVTAAIAVAILLRAWKSANGARNDNRILAMCATLTWNSVFSLYTPIYDMSLMIPNMLMTADVLYRRPRNPEHPPGRLFGTLAALLVLAGWLTQSLARAYGFQPATLILLAVGTYQAILASHELPVAGGRGDSGTSSRASIVPIASRGSTSLTTSLQVRD
jgi:hypothetical protein